MQVAAPAMLSTSCLPPFFESAVQTNINSKRYEYVRRYTHIIIATELLHTEGFQTRPAQSWTGMENPELPPREGKINTMNRSNQ
jgi:hypothetical protein